jgi:glycosyltransferase involved in cell wall biosynthesis
VIVAFWNMSREAPRTLFSLSPAYQRGIGSHEYEVIAVDCGSDVPMDERMVRSFGSNFRLLRFKSNPSPAGAINEAVKQSHGNAVMICIDGARILSPGILRLTLKAFQAFENMMVTTIALHLGPKVQNASMTEGYDQVAEDRLLDSVDWRNDGYELFRISVSAFSSSGGWFSNITESNCFAVHRNDFKRLGGLEERFCCAGAGLVNLDFYKRACQNLHEIIMLLGEGTFHQFHGGVATNVPISHHPFGIFHEEYIRIRGEDYVPTIKRPLYLGSIPDQMAGRYTFSANTVNNPIKS